jgi:hypothetical protein
MVRGKQHARQYNTSQPVDFSGLLGKHGTLINLSIKDSSMQHHDSKRLP